MARSRIPIPDHQRFLRTLAEALLDGAEAQALPAVQQVSKTLAQYLTADIWAEHPGEVIGALSVPHYWAQYAHDGRGGFGPNTAQVLVWFRNPLNDPRLAAGYPIRRAEIKKLTKQQWDYWVRVNRRARARNVPEPMIVRRFVGPAKGTPFFSNDFPNGGMAGFPKQGKGVATLMARQHIRAAIEPTLDLNFTWNVRVVGAVGRR